MAAFKQSFVALVVALVLMSSAGPTLAIQAVQHRTSHSRFVHNKGKFGLPRLSSTSQNPHLSETSGNLVTTVQVTSGSKSCSYDVNETTTVVKTATVKPYADLASPSFSSLPRAIALETSASLKFTPNGIKAGVAGGDAYPILQDHLGWWYDWSANPSKPGTPIGVPMLWGSGHVDSTDASRLKEFQRLSLSNSAHPPFVLGYEEPDCSPGGGSSGMNVEQGVKEWEALMAPLKRRGTKIGSPSMCKQADETWLEQFAREISTPWDFTAIHVNKNNLDGVRKDIDHYWNTYRKPIWVTEFACVNDHNTFQPCTNQQQINLFIHQVVEYFEQDSRVFAYAFSNGEGLGNVWPMMRDGRFSESGKAYLAAISKYH